MSLILIVAISLCVTSGILLLLSRDVFKVIMGLTVLGSATNLVVFSGGNPGSLVPAVIEQGSLLLAADAASPLPQALVLTAVVIGFALLCFALLLAAAISSQQGQTDVAAYNRNEPRHHQGKQPDKPAIMEMES